MQVNIHNCASRLLPEYHSSQSVDCFRTRPFWCGLIQVHIYQLSSGCTVSPKTCAAYAEICLWLHSREAFASTRSLAGQCLFIHSIWIVCPQISSTATGPEWFFTGQNPASCSPQPGEGFKTWKIWRGDQWRSAWFYEGSWNNSQQISSSPCLKRHYLSPWPWS